jgi:hypothetical protein
MTGKGGFDHRVIRWVFAFAIGFALAFYAFQRISDPEPRRQRAREEAVVVAARTLVQNYVLPGGVVETVDPLAPQRKVGKVYVYPTDSGWEVSGYYRRDAADRWHPFLIGLDKDIRLKSLSVRDADEKLAALAAADPKFSVVP